MSTYHSTLAITLHRRDVRDDSRFLSFYSEDLGKIQAIATSARKVKSKLAGHLEPFGIIQLGFVRGHRSVRITSAQTVEKYRKIMTDMDLVLSGGYCLRFVYSLVRDGVADNRLFHLLRGALETLNTAEKNRNIKIFNAIFTLKAMSLLGYNPELSQCTRCQKKDNGEESFFSFALGGVLCIECRRDQARTGMRISPHELGFVRECLVAPLEEIFTFDKPVESMKKFNTLVTHFFTYHLLT